MLIQKVQNFANLRHGFPHNALSVISAKFRSCQLMFMFFLLQVIWENSAYADVSIDMDYVVFVKYLTEDT